MGTTKFYIEYNKTLNHANTIKGTEQLLNKQKGKLDEVYNDLWIGNDTESVKEALFKISHNLDLDAKDIKTLGAALESIVKMYATAEANIMRKANAQGTELQNPSQQTITNPNGTEEAPDEVKTLDDILKEATGLTDEEISLIKLILGFIPVLNCLVDIYDIINDFQKARKDGEISLLEWGGLIMDVAFLVLDAVSAVKFIRSATEAVKKAKAASTTAKELATDAKKATEAAEQATKAAEKAAAKSGGSVPVTKAARKATKAKNAAETAKNAADDAVKAAEDAKKAAKEAGKKVQDVVEDGIKDNVKQRYAGNKSEPIPRKASSYVKDVLINGDLTPYDFDDNPFDMF